MIEKLSECAKCEFEKGIEQVDTKEMGEVVDILKDLCEAEYYSKISKAMDEYKDDDDDDEKERRYYRGQPRDSKGRYMSGGKRYYEEPPYYHMTPEMYKEHTPEWYRDMDRERGKMYYTETMPSTDMAMRDAREGKSGQSRRTYIETKEMHKANTPADKQIKMKELENYAKELSEDVTEMISDATPEERNLVKTKLQTLAQKIQ